MIRRLFPTPILSLVIIGVWILLVNRFAWGSLVFAAILGVVIPLITARFSPSATGLKRPHLVPGYLLLVLYDIIIANIDVAKIVLFMPSKKLQPAWITVPLDLRTTEAITILAGTITLTPGTVTADLSADGHSLLVHCLHAPDPDSVRDDIKARYESRLKEIFE